MEGRVGERPGEFVVAFDDHRAAAGDDFAHQPGAGRDAARGKPFHFQIVGHDETAGSVRVCPDQAEGPGVGAEQRDGAGDDAPQQRLQIEFGGDRLHHIAQGVELPQGIGKFTVLRGQIARARRGLAQGRVSLDLGGDKPRHDAHGIDLGLVQVEYAPVVRAEGAEDPAIAQHDRNGDVGAGADEEFARQLAPMRIGIGIMHHERGQRLQHRIAERVGAGHGDRRLDAETHAVTGMGDDEVVAIQAVDHGQADTGQIGQERQCAIDGVIERGKWRGGVCGQYRQPSGGQAFGRHSD